MTDPFLGSEASFGILCWCIEIHDLNGTEVWHPDTKYYGKTMQVQYDKATIHSGNVYQIFTYVKNQDAAGTGNVSGMLLYAKTEESITPDCSYVMGGNRISVKTLDLNKEFSLIAAQLDKIAEDHFGKELAKIG